MKSNYEERKQKRLEGYLNSAEKAANESNDAYDKATKIGSNIPMGQPILVGHHSEGRHRRDIKKIDNNMRKSVDASKKAKYYEGRAEALLNNTSISSDDPNAIDKLQAKLEWLEKAQELYKQINKVVRSAKISDIDKVNRLVSIGLLQSTAIEMLIPDRCHGIGIPSYKLTNNGANIRNTKQRIEYLLKIATIVSSEEVINGVRFVINSEDNRVQLFFSDIPAQDTRTQLKRGGFRWAPSVGAWMRQISNSAIWTAKTILNTLK